MAPSDDLVLVTGASGFIASHVIKQLLEAGYKVRGTLRSLKSEAKVRAIRNLKPDAKSSLELVEADLKDANTWESVIQGCTYIIHTAYRYGTKPPENPEQVMRSSINVSLNMLKIAKESGTVKRFVLTGSNVSYFVGNPNKDGLLTEEDWANVDQAPYYIKFKTMEERAAWNYIENLEEGEKLGLVVIHPGNTIGPNLSASLSISIESLQKMLKGEVKMFPDLHFGFSDVRDVAAAHVKALSVPGAAGHRIVVDSGTCTMPQMARIVQDEFKPQGYNVGAKVAPKIMMKIIGLFVPKVKFFNFFYGYRPRFDNSLMRDVLGIEPRPMEQAIKDCCYDLIETGFVPKTSKYRGPESK